ncbi:hypothetical protein GETHLI_09050 [Geothrix limicola]|uniref:Uncharacterized protein n=1 Tax=Geothrix limicola TaxID=2927978 RepID=A0ABQ5QDD9_9BACT|nr:hypothetical protein [Geothrix limicola]GLH72403.1 hypothetical protein GETHLI_09050 [Geothrix limicola]
MSTKQVKVHAGGCAPGSLELFKNKDEVIFVQGEPDAPLTVHVDNRELFGTSTCTVGSNASDAPVYKAQAPGNYTIALTPSAMKAGGNGTIQVICFAPSTALGAGSSGSIKVTG